MKKFKIILTLIVFTMLLTVCLSISSNASSRFTDVPKDYWAEDAICFCYYHGAFYTQSDIFEYDEGLTRAVAVDGIRRMLDINVAKNANTPFSDVPYSYEYSGSIKWASDNGITQGTGNGMFSPNTVITRQEFATLVHRALTVVNATLPTTKPNLTYQSFTDSASIASWARDAVTALTKAEIIVGKPDGSFAPTATIDRSSGATMLSKMYAIYKYPGNEILFYVRTAAGAPIANATVYVYFDNVNSNGDPIYSDKYPEQAIKTNSYGIAKLSTSSNLQFSANAFAIGYQQGITKNDTETNPIYRSNFINTIEMALDSGAGYSLPLSGFNNMNEWANTLSYVNQCRNFGWRYGMYSELVFHQGIDIAKPVGTPVYSVSSGTVVYADEYGNAGNLIQIETCYYHDETNSENDKFYYFIYQHLNTYSVRAGSVVQEQKIATSGNSGSASTGAHLHFSISNTQCRDTTSREFMDPLAFIRNQTPYYDYDYNGNPVGG